MLVLSLLIPLISAQVSTLVQVLCEPPVLPVWPPSSVPLPPASLSLLTALSRFTKVAYAGLLSQEQILPHSRFTSCTSDACLEAMKAYTESLFDTNSVEIVANETMTEPVATCPRAQYLLKRDNVAAAAHLEIMEQMKQFQGEIQDVLGLNASNIYDLVGFAKYSALGGRYPGLSDAAHQWFSTFHSHFSTNLMVGVFDQGKMLTYELLSDIMTQIEDWTPFSLYIVTKETYIALLKILTLYSGQVNWGDSLTMAVTRSPDSEISLTFFIQDTPLDNEYCGSPCILATFMEKMRGKRMYASRALFRKACEYLGDEDLSWKKYYLMVGAMVGIILMFKGSDWLVRKTAPKPKKE